MATQTRSNDPDKITLSRDDFVQIARNGGAKSSLRDWLRIIVAVSVPVVILITFFNKTAFQVEQNKEDIKEQQIWIAEHAKDTAAIRKYISDVAKQQAVILEKVESVRKDIERLGKKQ